MSQTEITVQIFENIEKVKQTLISLGFNYKDTFSGTDIYFSTCKINEIKNVSFKNLIDNSLIVRSFNKSSSNVQESMIVHKLKTLDANGNNISEQKTSVKIDNPSNACNLFTNAGLTKWLTLNQINSFYTKDEVTIIIGIVGGLDGCFIEIEEYPSIGNLSSSEKFNHLTNFVKSLNLKTGSDFSCKKSLMLFNKNNTNIDIS